MCSRKREWIPESRFLQFDPCKRRRRSRVQVHRFMRRRKWEEKNLKLYLENRSILEENMQLRKKALLLRQENLALLSLLQKRFSHQLANPSFE